MDDLTNRPPGVSLKARITDWLAAAILTWSNKTLADPAITGSIKDANGATLLSITPAASAANYFQLSNASGSSLSLKVAGTASNINPQVQPKGTGVFRVLDSAGLIVMSMLNGVASAVNYVTISNNSTGLAPKVLAGGETNVDLIVDGAGTGVATDKNGNRYGKKVAVPASATATGVPGQWAVDSSFVYFCTAANTWVRGAVATW